MLGGNSVAGAVTLRSAAHGRRAYAVVIVLGIYDLVCVASGSVNNSVSSFLVNTGSQAPVVVFSFGFIAGHLFGYMGPVNTLEGKDGDAT